MCAIDECDPWEIVQLTEPRARKSHKCGECYRIIRPGEHYHLLKGRTVGDDRFTIHKTCTHCKALGEFMSVMCDGYPLGQLYEELQEHYYDGYASTQLYSWITALQTKWHDGTDPVPVASECAAEASRLIHARVGG